jgi:hypothetical protein
MRVVVLQPSYIPWLGYFDQIARSDAFVFYDDVQYDKNGWRNRNRIKTDRGWQWLTVPVKLKGNFGVLIKDVEVNEEDPWRRKHVNALKQWYGKAPYFDRVYAWFSKVLERPWEKLIDLNLEVVRGMCQLLGMKAQFIRSSELGIAGERSERLLRICQHFQADHYLSGNAAKDYLDVASFEKQGIRVSFQEYSHPVYPQLHGEFVSHLSAIDVLCNCGEKSLEVLLSEKDRLSLVKAEVSLGV